MLLSAMDGVCWWQVVVTCVLGLLMYWFISMWILRRKLPPGPFPMPILGNVLMMSGQPESQEYFRTLVKKYGDPMSFWVGNRLMIILDSKETIREVLVNQQAVFSSRQDSLLADLATDGVQDIALAKYGPLWRLHKKLASRAIRATIDNEKLEHKVNDVVGDIADLILSKGDDPIAMAEYISNIVYNIICSFAFGKTYTIDHPEFKKLLHVNKRGNQLFMKLLLLDFLPFMKYLPLERMFSSVAEMTELFRDFLIGYLGAQISEHRETYQEGEIRDFTDAMISEQKLLEKEGQGEMLTDSYITAILNDFFSAGTDTTSSSLIWFILYMVENHDVQEKCYHLISAVVGNRSPTVKDRTALPFVEACIMEALRLRPPVPLSLPHVPIQQAQLGPYTIPKDAIMVPNLYSMHVSPDGDFTPHPEQFDPEHHFLEPDGESVRKPSGFMPFGGGRRACLGEQLARNDLFLVATGLLQKLKFCKVLNETYSFDCDPSFDAICSAKPYLVRCEAR